MNISHGQEIVTDPNLTKQTQKIDSSATPSPEHNGKRHEDLNAHMDPIHTIVTLLHGISKQLYNLSHQVERTQQSRPQDNKSHKSKEKKPKTRTCFKCNKRGHIAKHCRTRLLQNGTNKSTNPMIQIFKETTFHSKPNYDHSRNIGCNPPTNHTINNG